MSRMGRRAVGAALVAGVVAGCVSDRPATGPEPPSGGGPNIAIENFAYVPADLSVKTGTVVTWANQDDVSHTVSADDDETFDSGVIGQGESFGFTAGAPGTYGYFCRIHPFMKATLTVTP